MISGGEIFIVVLFILIFFGANKIPEFARMMGKGVREFRKATEDIKREINDNTSGVMDDIKAIREDITSTVNNDLAQPMQQTLEETASTVESYSTDYYYDNKEYDSAQGNEYAKAAAETPSTTDDSSTTSAETPPATNDSSTTPAETPSAIDDSSTTPATS